MTRAARWLSIVLLSLLFFVGVSSFFGGITLLAQPAGTVLRMPLALLAHTPFDSFAVPGLLLTLLGVLHLFAVWAVLERWPSAWLLSAISGGGVVVWTSVQLGMIGYVTFLQPLYAAIGVAIFAAAFAYAAVEARGESAPLYSA